MKPNQIKSNRPDDFLSILKLQRLIDAFLLDRKAQNLSRHTIRFYRVELSTFATWAKFQGVELITHINPDVLRSYFIHLQEHGRNPGGVHGAYRTIRVFLRWYAVEFDVIDWANPLSKIKPPRVDVEALPPVPIEHIRALIETCERGKFTGDRDRSIFLFLLDTGVRSGELLALDRDDIDLLGGDVIVRKSKSRKARKVFLGRQARKALRAYLKVREDAAAALFVSIEAERLKPSGLRQILRRRAALAGIPTPTLHSFRRAFALAMVRAGTDLLTIARLLGHADLSLLSRYIRQEADDLRDAHAKADITSNL